MGVNSCLVLMLGFTLIHLEPLLHFIYCGRVDFWENTVYCPFVVLCVIHVCLYRSYTGIVVVGFASRKVMQINPVAHMFLSDRTITDQSLKCCPMAVDLLGRILGIQIMIGRVEPMGWKLTHFLLALIAD